MNAEAALGLIPMDDAQKRAAAEAQVLAGKLIPRVPNENAEVSFNLRVPTHQRGADEYGGQGA